MRKLKILLACEESGTLRNAFCSLGSDAFSCDMKESRDNSPYHIQGNVVDILSAGWDFMFAFPPCTYLCKAQMFRYRTEPGRIAKRDEAVEFVKLLMTAEIPHIAIENPIGYLSPAIRPPDQIVYTWWFGDPYRKDICLWLKNMPPLISTCINPKRKTVSNHTNSRMSAAEVSHIRSSWSYFPRMANAIAAQYHSFLCHQVKAEKSTKKSQTGSYSPTLKNPHFLLDRDAINP